MHVATKIILGLGVIITLVGVLFTISGGSTLDNITDIDIEEVSVWNGTDGTYNFNDEDVLIFVRDNVRCDSFTFSMTNDSGEYPYENDKCTDDGSMPAGHSNDPEGWYHIGSVNATGEYVIDASSAVYLAPSLSLFGEVLTEAAGGVLSALAGLVLVCCGILFLILGGIFALFLGTEDTTVGLVAGSGGFSTSSVPTTSVNIPLAATTDVNSETPPSIPISETLQQESIVKENTESSFWEIDDSRDITE